MVNSVVLEKIMNIQKKGFASFVVFCCVLFMAQATAAKEYRIVSMAPNWTNVVASIGAVDELVGVTRYCIFPDSIPRMVEEGKLQVVGRFMDMKVDEIDALEPDVVLTASKMQRKYHMHFKKNHVKVIHMDESSLAETYEKILELGIYIGHDQEAIALVNQIINELNDIRDEFKDAPKVSVYYEINYFYKCVPGSDSYMTELIKLVGGNPIFSERPGLAPSVTWEEVVEKNPEVILLPWWSYANDEGPHYEGDLAGCGTTTPRRIAAREGADRVSAVQTGKVRYIDSAKTKQAGPLIPTAARLFAEAIRAEGNKMRYEREDVPRDINEQ